MLNRLRNVEARLDRDPQYAELYYAEMWRIVYRGYTGKVNAATADERMWYLSHFPLHCRTGIGFGAPSC